MLEKIEKRAVWNAMKKYDTKHFLMVITEVVDRTSRFGVHS